jgi:hypothetical protein
LLEEGPAAEWVFISSPFHLHARLSMVDPDGRSAGLGVWECYLQSSSPTSLGEHKRANAALIIKSVNMEYMPVKCEMSVKHNNENAK